MNKEKKYRRLEKRWRETKEELYAIIKEELEKRDGKKFEINGELWDGTEIRYIKLNAEGLIVIDGVVADITHLWSVASVEDLFWIAGEMV